MKTLFSYPTHCCKYQRSKKIRSEKMSQRGRGCLEIRPSDSAFYRTTTSEIGDRPEKNYDTRELMNGNTKQSETLDDNIPTPQSFAFLYTKESDKIGSKVRMDGVNANLQMTLSNARRGRSKSSAFASQAGTMSSADSANQKTDEILLSYKQGTKVEDPRFTTSSNEYG